MLDAYNSYTSATGATADETTGLLRIDPSQYSSLSDLTFTIGSVSMTLPCHILVSSLRPTGNVHLHAQRPDLASIGECRRSFNSGNGWLSILQLNSVIGGSDDYIYLLVQDVGFLDELFGLDFINGQTWLERYYFVYDSASNEVGFATTSHTYDTSN